MMVLGQYRSVLIDTWWYWVNMERHWLIYDGIDSVEGSNGRYLVVLGQKKAILGDTLWYWGSIGPYLLVHGGYGSV